MIGDLEYRKAAIQQTEKRIKKVIRLESQIEKLYNEIFSPELWRAGEAAKMARMHLEAELRKHKELLNELSVKP